MIHLRTKLANLIRVPILHGINRHAYKFGRNASSTVLLDRGKHGDVASESAAAVVFEFAYYDTSQLIGFGIQSLKKRLIDFRSTNMESKVPYHVTEVAPLVQEISIDIYAVGLWRL